MKIKKFAGKFDSTNSKDLDFNKIYYSFYENKIENLHYKLHSYLRLFPTGQYAMFYERTDSIPNFNDIKKAFHVGYFIVENDVLKLETPTGNGNTFGYRIINKFKITNDTLKEFKNRITNRTFSGKYSNNLKKVKPDW